MSYKDKLLYNYLVDRGIGFVVICLIIFSAIEIICAYPNPLVINMNITDQYLGLFFAFCLGYGFIEITARIIAGITFFIYKLVTFIYYKIVKHKFNESTNRSKENKE